VVEIYLSGWNRVKAVGTTEVMLAHVWYARVGKNNGGRSMDMPLVLDQ